MSQRFLNPFPQFFNSTPTVLSGAKLFFYEAGTSTKLATYPTSADAIAGTNANSNPVLLNSSGYPASEIFLKNQAYKVVLAPSTDADPPTSPIWSVDNYWGTDFKTVVETKVGSGSPAGVVAGTASSSGVLPTFYWDYTGAILYVCTTTGAAASAVWTAINASASTPAVPPPQGYLTLVTATPVITSDQASKTVVYYTPFVGNLIPIHNGSSMTPTEFSELTLTLTASHTASAIYDVFVWSESGVLTIGTGPAWTTATAGAGARGTGASTTQLTRVKGLLVNAVAITARNSSTTYSVGANLATYVGSIFIDGTAGQVTCHTSFGQSRKWAIWNAYNRQPLELIAGDSGGSWNYNSPTIRASNGSSANSLTLFSGLAEERAFLHFGQYVGPAINTASGACLVGIGYNSTTAASGRAGIVSSPSSAVFNIPIDAEYTAIPSLGINVVTCLESTPTAGGAANQKFNGTEENMRLTARWRG